MIAKRSSLLSRSSLLLLVVLSGITRSAAANDAVGTTLDPNHAKNGSVIRYLFSDLANNVSRSTVRILCDGEETILGVIVDDQGAILTKASELKGAIRCRFKDGRELPARKVAEDASFDLALLQVDADGLIPIRWSKGKDPEVGRWSATPGIHGAPIAVGIISVPRRSIPAEKAILGVSIRDTQLGPRVLQVIEESAAEKAGLASGDRILSINGVNILSAAHLTEIVRGYPPETVVKLTYERETREHELDVTLGAPIPSLLHPDSNAENIARELSHRRADFPAVIQHDSVLDPSDCGGPLIDLKGNVIGLNIARAGRTGCYAIPAGELPKLIADLQKQSTANISTDSAK
ncbi:MAG: S1C family serine protease [Planctomycetaceae bacterium]